MAIPPETRPHLCLIEDDGIMGESLTQRYPLEGFAAAAALESRLYRVMESDIRQPDRSAGILSPGPLLGANAFFGENPVEPGAIPLASPSLTDYLMACERDFLIVALERHNGHLTQTAEALWEKMKRFGLAAREDA
ncbi:MAG: two component, sigma54 specific, transcriptional regulator, Fis family [Proteobacteria bacterium]|nr:two component, sigma54 specific, transcriptional regulator, Fis family [Pseudomonadota bacterium]